MTEKMPIRDIVLRLGHWKARIEKMETQIDAFAELTGARGDCPFLSNIYDLVDAYTASVSELVGDQWDWLIWYKNECELGKVPRAADIGGKVIGVRTLRQLAAVIRRG